MHINDIARVAHEVNRAYCESMGDYSQLPWDSAPQWQKESAINGVCFYRDNPVVTPADSQENWLKEKKAGGWVYGELKDPALRTHPCMVPYSDLPQEQKVKDHLFVAIVRSLLAL